MLDFRGVFVPSTSRSSSMAQAAWWRRSRAQDGALIPVKIDPYYGPQPVRVP